MGTIVMLRAAVLAIAVMAGPSDALAAELRAATVAGFDHYVRVAEARMAAEEADPQRFLLVDGRPPAERAKLLASLRAGEVVMDRLRLRDQGRDIEAPDGMLHHWVGLVFLPGVTVKQAVALMQDYDRHASVFAPAVVRAKLLDRTGDRFRVLLRFHMKKVIAVTVDTENVAEFVTAGPDRVHSAIRSTRVQEVDKAGTAAESQKPEGQGGGFLWRLNTYWRYLERDGGTYIQCESISLSRDIPFGLGWIVGPFVTSIPRESLVFTMASARKALVKAGG
jgi:hypothetical protein